MRFTNLKLTNVTVFKDAEFEFGDKINVFVGANGTGKTHALKVLYYMQFVLSDRPKHPSLSSLFADDVEMWDLVSSSASRNQSALLEASSNVGTWSADFSNEPSPIVAHEHVSQSGPHSVIPVDRPVFIPSVDMLAHTKGFLSTWELFKIDFDQTYRDIVLLLLSPEKRNAEGLSIDLPGISGGLALELDEKEERFYVTMPAGRFAAPLVSEGVRKLATLAQLIRNDSIRPGTTLFWDEPEVSVNPSLMTELVKMILTLANAGVQVFLATHNYELLKELDLQAKEGDVRYFALELVKNEAVVHPANSYDEIQPNKIAEEFDSLYDRQLKRATGRWRKNGDGR